MDSNGYYCGWVDYTVTVTPSLTSEFNLRISGRDYHGLKDSLYETFEHALSTGVDPYSFERESAAKAV